MDKETLSNYGWIVITVLVLAVMIALATPFASYIKTAVENTTDSFITTANGENNDRIFNAVGLSRETTENSENENNNTNGEQGEDTTTPSIEFSNGATYINNSTITQTGNNTYRVLINTNSIELKSVGIKITTDNSEITNGTWLVSGTTLSNYNVSTKVGSCAYSNTTTISGNIFQIDFTLDDIKNNGIMTIQVIAKNGATTLFDETATTTIPATK